MDDLGRAVWRKVCTEGEIGTDSSEGGRWEDGTVHVRTALLHIGGDYYNATMFVTAESQVWRCLEVWVDDPEFADEGDWEELWEDWGN